MHLHVLSHLPLATTCVQALYELGADLHARVHHECTALHAAAALGRLEAVKQLTHLGVDLHARTQVR